VLNDNNNTTKMHNAPLHHCTTGTCHGASEKQALQFGQKNSFFISFIILQLSQ